MVAIGVLLAAGCDDEVTKSPDAAINSDGGGTADAGATDAPVSSSDLGSPSDAAAPAPDTTPLTAQQERGRYLVNNVIGCPECHTPHDAMGKPVPGKFLSGWECFVKAPNGDCLSSRNLTNHATGLANRTPEEIKNMFRNGLRPPATGGGMPTALNPVMPYYVFHNMDDDDADAIVAYLRTVEGVEHAVPARGMFWDVPAPAPYLDPSVIPMPLPTAPNQDSALHGRYLASKVGLCIECHTKHVFPPMPGPVLTDKYFQGGEPFDFGFPELPVSANLTSDSATGLGTWSVDDIVRVLKEGKDKQGKGICPPMPVGPTGAYGGLSYQDTLDIANYIKSLPPATNMVPDMCSTPFGPPPPMGDSGMMMSTPDGAAPDAATSTDGATTSSDGSAANPG